MCDCSDSSKPDVKSYQGTTKLTQISTVEQQPSVTRAALACRKLNYLPPLESSLHSIG